MKEDIYFSIDIETNGLCPGIHSMISLGAVAFDLEKELILQTFKVNLLPLTDCIEGEDTMEWWKQFPEAFHNATIGAIEPREGIKLFVDWVEQVSINKTRVAAYWKPEFDGAFVRYYLFKFNNAHIFGRSGSGVDIKTTTALALNWKYSETQIGNIPRKWCGSESEHSHDACDDALEQAHVYMNAIKELKRRGIIQ